MLFVSVVIAHIIASAILCMFILLHAGRGGGLSDMFGGGMGVGGSTVAEKNLDRMTVFAATLFTVTTISLGFLIKDRDNTPPAPLPSTSMSTFPSGEGTPSDLSTGVPSIEFTPTSPDGDEGN